MRVALFGGTFDPPHRGHVAVARAAADRFALDTVFFAPAGIQPLKPAGPTAGFSDRLAMTALACADDPRFALSNLDAPRPDRTPNYSVRTLGMLADLLPGATLFNIVGADSFRTLGAWREPERLLELAEWIVVSRPGIPPGWPENFPLDARQQSRVHRLDGVAHDVSASEVRERLHTGRSCEDLLPAAVAAYITQHGLYSGLAPP